jgi:hypothetical protein
MNDHPKPNPVPMAEIPKAQVKVSFWRKLGGRSLSISLFVHGILLIIAVLWILGEIPKEAKVDFMPNGGGGGAEREKSLSRKRAQMTPMAARVSAVGSKTAFVLPEADPSSSLLSVGALNSGNLSGGLGGSGSGGGRGTGTGEGFGSGNGPGLGGGNSGIAPFGMVQANRNSLVGVLYDAKQDKQRKDTGVGISEITKLIDEFVGRGWDERLLTKYYQAPQKLYQTKIYMPRIVAEAAPAAFNCANEVQARCWMVLYQGEIIAPKTFKFRFVGAGDDVLVVRFNKKNVFDHGYTLGTAGLAINNIIPVLDGSRRDDQVEKVIRRGGTIRPPVTYYHYDTTPAYNADIGGLAVGQEIEVVGGRSYPIEILISEIPGVFFSAVLMMQESGVNYEKTSRGSPILPPVPSRQQPP